VSRHLAALTLVLAWALWLDQAPYNLRTRENRAGAIQSEGVPARRVLIATTATKAECEALRGAQARQREQQRVDERGYKARHRFICLPQ
jgi:hypothetical protein